MDDATFFVNIINDPAKSLTPEPIYGIIKKRYIAFLLSITEIIIC